MAWLKLLFNHSKHFITVRTVYYTFIGLTCSLLIPGFSTMILAVYSNHILLLLGGDIETNPEPNIDLNCLFANINSIKANNGLRFEFLKNTIQHDQYKLVVVCEVGDITSNQDSFIIDGYTMFYQPLNRGILVYAHDSVTCELKPDLMQLSNDSLWVKIRHNDKSILMGSYYRSPSQSPDQRRIFMSQFQDTVKLAQQQITSIHDSLIVLGDFNSHHNQWC